MTKRSRQPDPAGSHDDVIDNQSMQIARSLQKVLPKAAMAGYRANLPLSITKPKKLRKQPEPWEFTDENPLGESVR